MINQFLKYIGYKQTYHISWVVNKYDAYGNAVVSFSPWPNKLAIEKLREDFAGRHNEESDNIFVEPNDICILSMNRIHGD